MFEKSFMQAFIAGEVEVYEYLDYIQYWHSSGKTVWPSLRHGLGLTEDEFAAWQKCDDNEGFFDALKTWYLENGE